MPRAMEQLARVLLVPLLAVAASVLAGMLTLWLTGYPALGAFRAIVQHTFQDWYGVGQVLHTTTLLTFTGLAVAAAFRAGLFNIGVEGQLTVAAVAVGIAGAGLKSLSPAWTQAVPGWTWIAALCVLAALAGAVWAAIPGLLKAATGAHEVITTIMMNFVAFAGVNYLLRPEPGSFAVPATLHTASVARSMRLPRLSELLPQFQGSVVNASLFLALGTAIALHLLLKYSRTGYDIRVAGLNPVAARASGISTGRTMVIAMALSGALAGMVGVDFVLGYKGYFEKDFSAGIGFIGIAVALLANNHPLGVVPAALLFGVLNYAKVAASGSVPKDLVEIMEAVIIIVVVVGNRLFGCAVRRMEKRAARAAEQTA